MRRLITAVARDKRRGIESGQVQTYFDVDHDTTSGLETSLSDAAWKATIWNPFLQQWHALKDKARHQASHPLYFVDFCTAERLIPGVANRRLAVAIPGILVSLGILGTFYGLSQGLPAQEAGVGQGDINRLLAGLRTALQSSLTGIGLSLLFLFWDKLSMHALDRSVGQLDDVVAQFYPSISESVAQNEQQQELAETTQQLKTLSTDIAVALESSLKSVMRDAVAEAMQQELKPILEQLTKAVDALSATVSGDMAKTMQDVLNNLKDNLKTAIDSSFGELAESVKGLVRSQKEILTLLELAKTRMEEQGRIQEELTTRVIKSAESLDRVLGALDEITTRLQSAANAVTTATTQLSEATTHTATTHRELVDAQRELSKRVQDELERLESARTSILEAWHGVAAEARDSIQIIHKAVDGLGSEVTDKLLGALETFDSKLAEVTERFSGTLHEVRETIHELPGLLTKMTDSSQAMSDSTTSLRDELHGLANNMKISVGDATARAVTAADKLAVVTESTAAVATHFSTVIEQCQESVAAAAKQLKASTQGDKLAEIHEILKDTQQAIERLVTVTTEHGSSSTRRSITGRLFGRR